MKREVAGADGVMGTTKCGVRPGSRTDARARACAAGRGRSRALNY